MPPTTYQPQESRPIVLSLTSSHLTPYDATQTFVSRFTARKHVNSDAVVSNVRDYFVLHWPWVGPEEKEKFMKQDLEIAGPLFYPDALDDRIELATLFFSFCFLLDDIMDHWSHEQFQGLVFGTSAPSTENKVEVILAETFTRIRATDANGRFDLVTDLCREACAWFSAAAQKGRANKAVNLESYLDYRIVDAGYWEALALLRWASHILVPVRMREDPNIQLIELTAGFHGALVNDIYSYQREISVMQRKDAGEISMNIVNAMAVVMKEREMDEQNARRFLEEYVLRLEEKFVVAVGKAKAYYSGEDLKILEKYMDGLQMLCGGNFLWSTFCGRYHRAT